MAGQHDFTIEQGADFARTLTWKDSSGTAVNLAGYSARMQIRGNVEDADIALELTTANGRIALGGAAGTITLSANASATGGLSIASGVYDLELVSSSGVVTRLLEGNIILSKEVTR